MTDVNAEAPLHSNTSNNAVLQDAAAAAAAAAVAPPLIDAAQKQKEEEEEAQNKEDNKKELEQNNNNHTNNTNIPPNTHVDVLAAPAEHRYARANVSRPREYWDYDNLRVQWNSPDQYELEAKIGRGKYSDVFLGVDTQHNRKVVVKVLKPVKKKKIFRELRVLQILKGGPNIVELYDVVREPSSKIPSFVFEYVDASDFRVIFPSLRDREVRHYIYQVLIALEYAHSHGIMHRDVKPNNVCIDHKRRVLKLIDWGLAEFYHPDTSYNARVASRYFKGPELLVELPLYDYRLDMWSLGCMLAGIIFMREPFFKGKDNSDQLVRIVRVLGTDDLNDYLTKYELKLPAALEAAVRRHTKKPWSTFINQQNAHLCPPEAIDFLDRLLRIDHTQRIQAKEAMQHPYFDCVRAEAEAAAAATMTAAADSPCP